MNQYIVDQKGELGMGYRIPAHDGFRRELFWTQEENESTYYNFELDRQGAVPVRNLEEIRRELDNVSE